MVSTSVASMPMPALPLSVVGRQVEYVEDAPGAGDDHRQARREGLALGTGA